MRRRLLTILLVFLLSVPGFAQEKPAVPSDEQCRAAYEWFDKLGFPDVKDLRFVRAATGWQVTDTDPAVKEYVHGFLLGERDGTFTILTQGLQAWRFEKTAPGTPVLAQVYHEGVDLREFATGYLRTVRSGAVPEAPGYGARAELPQRARLFALARQCARKGQIDVARQLCGHLILTAKADPKTSLKDLVAGDFEEFMRCHVYDSHGNGAVSRKRLLAMYHGFINTFPGNHFVPDCRLAAGLLEKMVREDEEHAKTSAKPLAKMTQQERIAELIFRLRDQNGRQTMNPGSIDFFADPAGEKSPACQLLKIGPDAIPQLIEAIDDVRYTRSMDDWGGLFRVGDCAWAIIGEITGRTFGWDSSKDVSEVDVKKIARARAEMRQWLADFRRKGEKQMLIEGTGVGDESSVTQARRLFEKYPDAALTPTVEGARRAQDAFTRWQLVEIVTQVEGDAPVPFLLEELQRGPFTQTRVVAARALQERGHPAAVPAMIRLWQKERQGSDVIGFLAACGDPKGVQALGRDFADLHIATRFSIIAALGPDSGSFLFTTSGGEGPALPGSPARKAAADAAVADLLMAALDDTDAYLGCGGTWNGKHFSDPRICDMAGFVLSLRWPHKYVFDIEGTPLARERGRVALKNVRRREQKLAPLPLPEAKKPPEMAPDVARTLLAQLEAAHTDNERAKAVAALEGHALLALPVVMRHLEQLEMGLETRRELKALARRLSSIIGSVTFARQSVPPDDDFRKYLQRSRGKPLTAETLTDVMLHVARNLPAGTVGIRLDATREDDGMGVTLQATLLGVDHVAGGKPWVYDVSVVVGKEAVAGGRGACAEFYLFERGPFGELGKGIRRALDSPADERFHVSASVARGD